MHLMVQPMYCLKIPDQTVLTRNTVELWLQSTSTMLMKLGIWVFVGFLRWEDRYSYNLGHYSIVSLFSLIYKEIIKYLDEDWFQAVSFF